MEDMTCTVVQDFATTTTKLSQNKIWAEMAQSVKCLLILLSKAWEPEFNLYHLLKFYTYGIKFEIPELGTKKQ